MTNGTSWDSRNWIQREQLNYIRRRLLCKVAPPPELGWLLNTAAPSPGSYPNIKPGNSRVYSPSTIGQILPGHENPTKDDIVKGLRDLSASLRDHDWKLAEEGNGYITRFLSLAGLEVALCRTSIPCRGYKADFKVVRWRNEEGMRQYKFPIKAWIVVKGLPINHWNRTIYARYSSNMPRYWTSVKIL